MTPEKINNIFRVIWTLMISAGLTVAIFLGMFALIKLMFNLAF